MVQGERAFIGESKTYRKKPSPTKQEPPRQTHPTQPTPDSPPQTSSLHSEVRGPRVKSSRFHSRFHPGKAGWNTNAGAPGFAQPLFLSHDVDSQNLRTPTTPGGRFCANENFSDFLKAGSALPRTHPRLSRCARKPGGPGCGPLASQKKLPRGAQAGLAEAVRKRSRTGGERKNEREIV